MTITNRISDDLPVSGLRGDNRDGHRPNDSDKLSRAGQPYEQQAGLYSTQTGIRGQSEGLPASRFPPCIHIFLVHSYRANSEAVERGLAIAPVSLLAAHNHIQLYLNQRLASKEKASRKRERKEKKEIDSMQTIGRQLVSFT